MNTLEDLHTLKRLLYEFEFPVSPILEYAIKNKEEELMELISKAPNETCIEEQNENITLNSDIKIVKKCHPLLEYIETMVLVSKKLKQPPPWSRL